MVRSALNCTSKNTKLVTKIPLSQKARGIQNTTILHLEDHLKVEKAYSYGTLKNETGSLWENRHGSTLQRENTFLSMRNLNS